jgi:hypothetical protein
MGDEWQMIIDSNLTLKEWVESLHKKSDEIHLKLLETNPDYKAKTEIDNLIKTVEHLAASSVQHVPAQQAQEYALDLDNLSKLSRPQATLKMLMHEQRSMTTKEIVRYLAEKGIDISGTAPASISTSLARLEAQSIVKRQKRGHKSVWAIADSEKAKQKIANILQMPRGTNGGGRLTYGDIAEETLRKATHKLHVDEILKAVNAAGLTPSKPTLASGLMRDSKKRFKNIGGNIFVLTAWDS